MFRAILVVVVLLSADMLYAQQQTRTYSLVVTPDEANYLARLLEDRPLRESGNLYGKLQTQISQQDQAAQSSVVEGFRKQTREQMEKEVADRAAAKEAKP